MMDSNKITFILIDPNKTSSVQFSGTANYDIGRKKYV